MRSSIYSRDILCYDLLVENIEEYEPGVCAGEPDKFC